MYLSFLLSKLCENRKDQGAIFFLHGKRGDHLCTYPRTYPFLFHRTIFIFSLFILLQALHASLPPFVPTRFGYSFSLPSLLHSTLQHMFPYPIPTLFRSPSHYFLITPTPQPPQEASPTPGNRSRAHCKPSRRSRDRGHILCPRCLWIEREAQRPFEQARLLCFGVAYV